MSPVLDILHSQRSAGAPGHLDHGGACEAPVAVQPRREDASSAVRLRHHDHRPGAVPEHHGGIAFPRGFFDIRRHDLSGDDEDPRVRAEAHEVIGDGKRVEETRALAVYVERGDADEPELRSENASTGRRIVVGRLRSEHDTIKLMRANPGRIEGGPARDHGHVRRALAGRNEVPADGARASGRILRRLRLEGNDRSPGELATGPNYPR